MLISFIDLQLARHGIIAILSSKHHLYFWRTIEDLKAACGTITDLRNRVPNA